MNFSAAGLWQYFHNLVRACQLALGNIPLAFSCMVLLTAGSGFALLGISWSVVLMLATILGLCCWLLADWWQLLAVSCLLLSYNNALQLLVSQQQILDALRTPTTLVGRITEVRPVATRSHHRYRVCLQVERIGKQFVAKPSLLAFYVRALGNYRVDDSVRIDNVRITGKKHGFGLRENIVGAVFTHKLDARMIERPSFSWRYYISAIRFDLFRAMVHAAGKHAALVTTLFLGAPSNKTELPRQSFSLWGISHYLARSGLHVAVLIMIWYALLMALGVPVRLRNRLLFAVASLYGLFTFTTLSFLRAWVFFAVRQFFLLLERKVSPLHTLFVTACILIGIYPLAPFFVDFQLTVGLTLLLLITMRLNSSLA